MIGEICRVITGQSLEIEEEIQELLDAGDEILDIKMSSDITSGLIYKIVALVIYVPYEVSMKDGPLDRKRRRRLE